jgi:hypothetical protein
VFAKALADLLGMKSTGNLQEGIKSVNNLLQSELKTDINKISDLADHELLPFLANKNLRNNHLELLADLLFESAAEYSEEKRKNSYSKALILYQFITENDITYSINRHLKIEMIASLLKYPE